MTETTKTIFEKYEIRKTGKQKRVFAEWVCGVARGAGYDVTVESGLFGAQNIIIGDPEHAEVVYTAHYDTCAVLPFPNLVTPKNPLLYWMYQIGLSFVILVVAAAGAVLMNVLRVPYAPLLSALLLVPLLSLMLVGPANKHTANDNTSGVTVILDLLHRMPSDARGAVAFILFDMEESGLIGALSYRLKHNKAIKERLVVNFDCVSDGNNILIKATGKAKRFALQLQEAFESTGPFSVEVLTRGVTYPSDQEMFPCGVGVAALKRSRLLNILYMDRIHTRRDTVYNEENIEYLSRAAIRLVALLK